MIITRAPFRVSFVVEAVIYLVSMKIWRMCFKYNNKKYMYLTIHNYFEKIRLFSNTLKQKS